MSHICVVARCCSAPTSTAGGPPETLRLDPMLASLREDSRFERLLAKMRGDLARIRQNSTETRELFEKTVPALPPSAPPPPNRPK